MALVPAESRSVISSPALHLLTASSSRPPMSRETANVVLQPPLLCATGGLPPQLTQALHLHILHVAFWHVGSHSSYVKSFLMPASQAALPTRCETQSTHPLHCDDLQFFSQSQWHQEVHWPADDDDRTSRPRARRSCSNMPAVSLVDSERSTGATLRASVHRAKPTPSFRVQL